MTKPSDESYVRDLLDRLADERSLRELAQAGEKTYHDQWLKADETIRQIAKAVGADPQARDKLVELVTQEARSEERLNTLLRDLASCTPLLDVGSLLDDAISGWRIYRAKREATSHQMAQVLMTLGFARDPSDLSSSGVDRLITNRAWPEILRQLGGLLADLAAEDKTTKGGPDAQPAIDLLSRATRGLKSLQDGVRERQDQDKVDELLRAMVPYVTDDKPTAALEAWRLAGRRSNLFQETGQELGLTDSASPEQVLQRAREVAMVLRGQEQAQKQAQNFDAKLLAILGRPALTSREALLASVKELVALRKENSGLQGERSLLDLSELPVNTKCQATGTICSIDKRIAFGAWTPFTIKEIASDKSSVFIGHDRVAVGFWAAAVQPAWLASAEGKRDHKTPSQPVDVRAAAACELSDLRQKICYELGLPSPQLDDCREGLQRVGSMLRRIAGIVRSSEAFHGVTSSNLIDAVNQRFDEIISDDHLRHKIAERLGLPKDERDDEEILETIKILQESATSSTDLFLLHDRVAAELGLLADAPGAGPSLSRCHAGLESAGSLLRLLAQPRADKSLVDLAREKVDELVAPVKDPGCLRRSHRAMLRMTRELAAELQVEADPDKILEALRARGATKPAQEVS